MHTANYVSSSFIRRHRALTNVKTNLTFTKTITSSQRDGNTRQTSRAKTVSSWV